MIKYTIYLVTKRTGNYYVRIMANNGKVALNESVGKAYKLLRSVDRFLLAAKNDQVAVVRMMEKDFRAKFPTFAKNSGRPKRKV